MAKHRVELLVEMRVQTLAESKERWMVDKLVVDGFSDGSDVDCIEGLREG